MAVNGEAPGALAREVEALRAIPIHFSIGLIFGGDFAAFPPDAAGGSSFPLGVIRLISCYGMDILCREWMQEHLFIKQEPSARGYDW